jgi:hypothetical protein
VIAFAHLGHWYFELAFAAPALAVIGYMTRDSIRRRRRAKAHKRVPGKRR